MGEGGGRSFFLLWCGDTKIEASLSGKSVIWVVIYPREKKAESAKYVFLFEIS